MTCRYLLFRICYSNDLQNFLRETVRGFLKIYNFDAISRIHSIAATIESNATDGRKNFSSAD